MISGEHEPQLERNNNFFQQVDGTIRNLYELERGRLGISQLADLVYTPDVDRLRAIFDELPREGYPEMYCRLVGPLELHDLHGVPASSKTFCMNTAPILRIDKKTADIIMSADVQDAKFDEGHRQVLLEESAMAVIREVGVRWYAEHGSQRPKGLMSRWLGKLTSGRE